MNRAGPVIVAGGGIGGLAAALALVRQGFDVTVLEQSPEIGEIGAGIQLGPNAFAAFDALGVGEAARGRAVDTVQWNAASIWVGPNCHLAHYPLRGGEQYNVVVTFHSRQAVLGEALRVHGGAFEPAFEHYQRSRIARTARVVLSAREMRRIYHAKGVERLVRNELWQSRTPERFYDATEWLYGWQPTRCLAD